MSEIVHQFYHNAMATVYVIFIANEERLYAEQAAMAAFAEVDRIEQALNRFLLSSDIGRFNHAAPNEWMNVSVYTMECLSVASRIYAETEGAFDITIAPLMAYCRGPEHSVRIPSAAELEDARARVGQHALLLDESVCAVCKTRTGVELDLGAIGKGYAVDFVSTLLADWGIESTLINAGDSSLLGIGCSEEAEGWPVGVGGGEEPTAPYKIYLQGKALSGSGIREQGQHIMDPRTLEPVWGPRGVWSLVDTAMEPEMWPATKADALSTAFFVMPPEAVAAYCQAHPGVSAMLLRDGAEGPERQCYGKWDLIKRNTE